jgi:hypothetical protein
MSFLTKNCFGKNKSFFATEARNARRNFVKCLIAMGTYK